MANSMVDESEGRKESSPSSPVVRHIVAVVPQTLYQSYSWTNSDDSSSRPQPGNSETGEKPATREKDEEYEELPLRCEERVAMIQIARRYEAAESQQGGWSLSSCCLTLCYRPRSSSRRFQESRDVCGLYLYPCTLCWRPRIQALLCGIEDQVRWTGEEESWDGLQLVQALHGWSLVFYLLARGCSAPWE